MVEIRLAAALLTSLMWLCACHETGVVDPTPAPAAADPPSLWSIAVVERGGERRGVETAKVTICADAAVRAGFDTPVPVTDEGQTCALMGSIGVTRYRAGMRCAVEGRPFDVETYIRGDPAQDFYVDFRIHSVGAKRPLQLQTRHFRRVGPCPAGWSVGDNTDTHGRRRINALR